MVYDIYQDKDNFLKIPGSSIFSEYPKIQI
ncbi:hypothetical protein AO498_14872 [Algoriphagus sanaruensis]|uniref:Uncharacterized protein n=1 Tax=Algoriphagus sanaruensis TaxID=1727163 RepID=A0A142ERH9_9BACT|nr:hypothetical protein AO498_14872 [Algoriphagus sanaruensis]